MRWLVLVAVAFAVLLAKVSDAAGKTSSDSAVRFPFGWTPETTLEELVQAGVVDEDQCLPESEVGARTCFLYSSEYLISVHDFDVNRTSVGFMKVGEVHRIADVTLYAAAGDCDRMIDVRGSALALLESRYGRGSKSVKGTKFGSRACRDYMTEGLSFVRKTHPAWVVTVDTFFTSGEFSVFLSIANRATKALEAQALRSLAKVRTYEALEKL